MSTTEKLKQYQRQLRVERKEWGLCTTCGKRKPLENHVRCEACVRERKERLNRLRSERRAAGLCRDCGKPVFAEYSRCYEHYMYYQRASEKHLERRKIEKRKKEKTQ